MIELLLDDKQGNVWDISRVVTNVSWKTSRIGKPGSLEFIFVKGGLYENRSFSYANGNIVQFRYNGQNVFYGYIFSIDSGRDEAVKVTAYDQIRYLLANHTYTFVGKTAADVIRRIAADFSLRLGRIDTPAYVIPQMSEDGQKLLDIIDKSLALTLINSGDNYVFYDDFGALTLRNIEDLWVDVIVGDGSLMYDYSMKSSIDQDTYNQITIIRGNKETGLREGPKYEDSVNIARWGLLQLYQTVDDNVNDAQIKQLLYTLATLKNRETRSIQLNAIGDVRIRAGCYVPIIIEEAGINQFFLIDACSHDFSGSGDHTMSLELKVI